METKIFSIPNISCGHCVMSIKNELGELDGVKRVEDDVRISGSGPLAGRIVFVSYTSGEVDDLQVSGILDPDWLRHRQ